MSLDGERIAPHHRESEDTLARDFTDEENRWRYCVRRGRVWFDEEVRRAHRRLSRASPPTLAKAAFPALFTAPLIYSLILPVAVLDVWVSTYQWTCFPIYRIARVCRRPYFAIDWNQLGYLNGIEKIGCSFSSYVNGLIAYTREVAARTEQYWCPIKHARATPAPHTRYHLFFDYGDAQSYRSGLMAWRGTLRPKPDKRVAKIDV